MKVVAQFDGVQKDVSLATKCFADLHAALLQQFGLKSVKSLFYVDRDEENVNIVDNEDLSTCLEESMELDLQQVTIFVHGQLNEGAAPGLVVPADAKQEQEFIKVLTAEQEKKKEEKKQQRLLEEQKLKKLIEPRKKAVDDFVNPLKFAARLNACEGFELYAKLTDAMSRLAADCPGLRFNNSLLNRVFDDCGAQIAELVKGSYLKLMEEKKDEAKKILDQADSASRVYAEFAATLKDDTQQAVNEELKITNLKRIVNRKKQAERQKQKEEQLAKRESDKLKKQQEKARKELELQEKLKKKAEQEDLKKQKTEEARQLKEQREREKLEKQRLLEEKKKQQEEAKRQKQEEQMREILKKQLAQQEARKLQEKEIAEKKPLSKEEKQAKQKVKRLADLHPQADPKLIKTIVEDHKDLPVDQLQAKLAVNMN